VSTPSDDEATGASAGPAIRRGAVGALVLLGAVVGLFSALQATRLWHLDALHLSVGGLAALVANSAFGAFGAWGLRSRDAAVAPGVGWFLVVLALLFLPHPGGDILLPGSGGDVIGFLGLGFAGTGLAAVAAIRLAPRAARRASLAAAKRR
jgi:hypothetical protein